MELNWTNIDTIVKEVLLNDTEAAEWTELIKLEDLDAMRAGLAERGVIVVESCMQMVACVKERLEARRADVESMLSQLEDSFFETSGGGMSLMSMPFTKDGVQWGEQWQADLLYTLAAGLGLAWFTLPRDLWSRLPGGMPYITIKGR